VDTSCSPHVCTILVIEDDSAMREVVTVALRDAGYRVVVCANGREGLHRLRSQPETCLVLLDLHLPVMDGREFRTAQLRDRSLAWIPVIVMSGLPGAQAEADRLGATAVIGKPIDLDELLATIARIPCALLTPREEHRHGDQREASRQRR
jgi:two-component system chemotaxis response regulator CheY